ncbi:MAG: hypothetical protein OZSIB_1111 [Candidatus Ozemobacter sibiricus]|uniref:Uncharacterized protein n=1 Tax=Candidatus Ozemobacter sibiricus TaxID=2268124 RepID=A0A367ZKZ1_9BACT|nr:MAG: hypothetical protein OZSIB_1111 [Candidatus Ozemobacter sibiricus]
MRRFFEFGQWRQASANHRPINRLALPSENSLDVGPILGAIGKGLQHNEILC